MSLDEKVGYKLKKLREEYGYSVRDVGTMIDLSFTYISKIEKGNMPSLDVLQRLSILYGTTLSDLFSNEGISAELLNQRLWNDLVLKLRKRGFHPHQVEKIMDTISEIKLP